MNDETPEYERARSASSINTFAHDPTPIADRTKVMEKTVIGLEDAIQVLAERTNVFIKRVSCVSTPDYETQGEEPTSDHDDLPECSSLTVSLQRLTRNVHEIREAVNTAVNRLEI